MQFWRYLEIKLKKKPTLTPNMKIAERPLTLPAQYIMW